MENEEIIKKMLVGGIEAKKKILENEEIIKKMSEIINVILEAYRRGNKVISLGNGGSACDALHLAGELVGRYKKNRKSLRGIALTADTSVLTCIGNDYGYENIFSRQIEAQAEKGDIVIGYSTSGNSLNVINALLKAKEIGAITIGMSGGSGGKMKEICDYLFLVPTDKGAHMQEMHLAFTHILCEKLDEVYG